MIELTQEQKDKILENFKDNMDISSLTKIIFNDESLDGRSKEGRSVIKFLAENGLKAQTSKHPKVDDIELNEDQKNLILERMKDQWSSLQIAKELFGLDTKKLSKEQRTVHNFMNEQDPELMREQEEPTSSYSAPQAISRIIKKINDSTGIGLEEDKLSRSQKTCCEKLKVNLNNSRFIAIVNNYMSIRDKELFEQEFIRLTWDKPDLTPDELNLYMNVCKEIINLELITSHLQKLNDMFESADDQDEMTVRLAEIIKAKSAEYHQCESRIENLTKKLQGDRGERMKNKQKESASFLSIVQLFQEEEERENMVRIADMQKELIAEEAKRLEGMTAWKARVLGIGIDDVL
jgi:hypothetical protein|tara:strand:- start:3510 stop:4556 length:1047 start_codon:yes stop_codon:yes gene_type:complete